MISPTLARARAASSSGPTRFFFVAAARRSSAQASLNFTRIGPRPARPQRGDLLFLDLVVDDQGLQRLLIRLDERIHADDQLPLGVDVALICERGIGDLAAEEAGLDGRDHAAGRLDAVEVGQRVVVASHA